MARGPAAPPPATIAAVSLLLVHPSPLEGARVAARRPGVLRCGVGKAPAAARLTRAILAGPRPEAVLLFGVCGALPAPKPLGILELCLVGQECFADEGVATPAGFLDLGELGLPAPGPLRADPELAERVRARLGCEVPVVAGATVSTCSGTDAAARAVAERTGAAVETMEGAAVALACRELGVPWTQLRCVSNTTGDRDRQRFDLQGAADAVQDAVLRLTEGGWR